MSAALPPGGPASGSLLIGIAAIPSAILLMLLVLRLASQEGSVVTCSGIGAWMIVDLRLLRFYQHLCPRTTAPRRRRLVLAPATVVTSTPRPRPGHMGVLGLVALNPMQPHRQILGRVADVVELVVHQLNLFCQLARGR